MGDVEFDHGTLFQDAAERAAEAALGPLMEDLERVIDPDDFPGSGEAFAEALTRAFLAGAKAGAIEVAAQCVSAGIDVRLHHEFIDPAGYGDELPAG